MFLMWLGEQITERGLGNGISIIIFAGIAAGLPQAIGGTLELTRTGAFLHPSRVAAVRGRPADYRPGGIR
jgi:preprotein translocase subunit SecY